MRRADIRSLLRSSGLVLSARDSTGLRESSRIAGARPASDAGSAIAVRHRDGKRGPPERGHAGRSASLSRSQVHRVSSRRWRDDLPCACRWNPGPDLDQTLGLRPTSDVAAAITVPSHSMSLKTSDAVKTRLENVLLSPMGDFSRAMTVRQLADLLAYLASLDTAK